MNASLRPPLSSNRKYTLPSGRFLAVQLFLFLTAWIWHRVLTLGTQPPILDYAGILSLLISIRFLFAVLWIYAVLLFVWDRWGGEGVFRCAEGAVWLLFLAAVIWIDRRPLTHGLNSSGDHLMQFTLSVLTEYNLLHRGCLTGWCTAYGMGFPLNDLYPPGGNLAFCLMRALTLGLISQNWIYTACTFLSYIAFAALLYCIVLRWFGRLSGLILLFMLILDGGDGLFYGWPQFFNIGLWNGGLGLALMFYAFSECSISPFPPSRRRACGVIFSIAASILLHPIFIFLNGLWILLRLAAGYAKKTLGQELSPNGGGASSSIRWLPIALSGFAISAFWWIPFAASRYWIFSYGFWGRIMLDPGRAFWDGSLFPKTAAVLVVIGCGGIIAGLFSRRPFLRLLSLFCLINLFGGTETARHFFSLEPARLFFEHMQVERLAAAGKSGSFLLGAGYLGVWIAEAWKTGEGNRRFLKGKNWIWSAPSTRRFSLKAMLSDLGAIILAVIFLAPAIVQGRAAALSAWRWHIEPVSRLVESPPGTPAHWTDYLEALDFLKVRRQQDSARFFLDSPILPIRALTTEAWGMISAPAFSSLGIYVPYYMPAIILGTRPHFLEDWELDLANVKYVLRRKIAPPGEFDALKGLTSIYENEKLIVYRRESWSPKGWRVYGPAKVEPLPASGAVLRFRISGASAESYLRLGVSRYRKWKAYLNGRPVDSLLPAFYWEPVEAWKMIGVALQDGELEIRYESEWIDVFARLFSLGALLVLTLVIWNWKRIVSFSFHPRYEFISGKTVSALQIALPVIAAFYLATALLAKRSDVALGVRYLGLYADHVSRRDRLPDGEKDLCFQMEFVKTGSYGRAAALDLIQFDPEKPERILNRWSTAIGGGWPIAAMDASGTRCDRADGGVDLPNSRRQSLLLFISSPFEKGPPNPLLVKGILTYKDGAVEEISPVP
ncbi:MAG: hypothetical protein AB1656_12535 [Candidatus Omnitrophota bacterium]